MSFPCVPPGRWIAHRPGDRLAFAVVLDIAAGYHINADSGQIKPLVDFKPYPTRVTITAVSEGLTIDPPLYPPAHPVTVEFTSDPLMAFDGRTIVYVPMTLEKEALFAKGAGQCNNFLPGLR